MKISETQIQRFQCLWKSKTGKRINRKEALAAFRNLVSFVTLEIDQIIQDKHEKNR